MKIYRGEDVLLDEENRASDSELELEAETRATVDNLLQQAIEDIVVSSGVDSVAGLTGTVTAAGLKTALSLPANTNTSIGALQPLDSDLTAIAALAPANDTIIQRKSSAWTARTPAQLKTDLALVKGDVGLGNVDNTSDATLKTNTALTGTPTAPTAAVDVRTTQLATTAFVGLQSTAVVASATQSNSTVTAAVLTGQTFTIPAGKTARFRGILIFQSAATTTGGCYGIRVAQPSGASANAQGSMIFTAGLENTPTQGTNPTSKIDVAANANTYKEIVGASVAATGTDTVYNIDAIVKNNAAAHSTTVTFEFRSEVAASAITAQVGTSGIMQIIG